MINYDCGQYGFSLIFQLAGSVLPKVCVVSFTCSLICVALQVFLRDTLDKCSPDNAALNVLTSFTSILGFLVVFRWNHAHGRWWEGCTLLLEIRGDLFNAYSSSLAFCRDIPGEEAATKKFQHQLARLMSLLYNCALQQVTSTDGSDFELISLDGFHAPSIAYLAHAHDRVEIVQQWVQKLLVEAAETDIFPMAPPLLSRVFNQLSRSMTNVNNARKILQFPLPFPVAQLMSVMLILHSAFTVLLCAILVKQVYWAAVLTFVVVGSFFGVNFIAVEIEAPFGDDANDLPLRGFARDMNDSLIQLLKDSAQTVPGFVYTAEADFLSAVSVADIERQFQSATFDVGGICTWSTVNYISVDESGSSMNVTTESKNRSSGTPGSDTSSARPTNVTTESKLRLLRSASNVTTVSKLRVLKSAAATRLKRASCRSRLSRRDLIIKDDLSRRDVRKRASQKRRVDQAGYFVPTAAEGNANDDRRSIKKSSADDVVFDLRGIRPPVASAALSTGSSTAQTGHFIADAPGIIGRDADVRVVSSSVASITLACERAPSCAETVHLVADAPSRNVSFGDNIQGDPTIGFGSESAANATWACEKIPPRAEVILI